MVTMSSRSASLIAVVLGVAGGALFVATQVGSPRSATYYRVVDETTIAVGTITGRREWTRVTSVTETQSAVSILVKSLTLLPFPGTAVGQEVELAVQLTTPLGDRVVLDGFHVVPSSPLPSPTAKPSP